MTMAPCVTINCGPCSISACLPNHRKNLLPSCPSWSIPTTPANPSTRARSYLHANCSVCHVEAGGGNAKMELGFATAPERMNVFGARPQHDTFGIDNAMLISPGDAERSILFQRVSRRGRGQMPPLVITVVAERALALFRACVHG